MDLELIDTEMKISADSLLAHVDRSGEREVTLHELTLKLSVLIKTIDLDTDNKTHMIGASRPILHWIACVDT